MAASRLTFSIFDEADTSSLLLANMDSAEPADIRVEPAMTRLR